jgi:hypothetical protein
MKKAIILSAVASLGLASASFAALSNNHTLAITEIFTTAGAVATNNPSAAQIATDFNSGTTYIYRVTVSASLSGVTPTAGGDPQAFGIDDENYTVNGGLSRVPSNVGSARANWVANNPATVYDDNGSSVAIFQTNADEGASSSDLLSVTQIINNDGGNYNDVYNDSEDDAQVTDPRTTFANPTAGKLGTIDVEWNKSSGSGWLTLSGDQYALLDETSLQFGVTNYQADGVITAANGDIDPTPGSAAIEFAQTPEPASLTMLGLGALSLAARRRKA